MYELLTPPHSKIENEKNGRLNKYESRNSNIEILRILSMFLILGLHVNVFSLGAPSHEDFELFPISSFTRCILYMICIISVNLFVLISGWFSIKVKLKGFCNFIFQCVFILSLMYAIGICIGKASFNINGLFQCFFVMQNAWFINSYIGLYILSPLLNLFCERSSERQLRYILIAFYLFQTIYGNLFNTGLFIEGGYSTFSFIGLYLLARYLRLYGQKLAKYRYSYVIFGYLGLILIYCTGVYLNNSLIANVANFYTSPFNIITCCGILLIAVHSKPRYNSVINFIAASVFTVYLCHVCNTWTTDYFREISRSIFEEYSGIHYLMVILAFMISVFVFAIFIDQIRKWVWKLIFPLFATRRLDTIPV